MTAPTIILISGPNGAGKTTLARQMLPMFYTNITFLNADEIQREAKQYVDPIAAGREFLRRLEVVESGGGHFAVETTLATPTYARRIRQWHSCGYQVELHFIELPSADVRLRYRDACDIQSSFQLLLNKKGLFGADGSPGVPDSLRLSGSGALSNSESFRSCRAPGKPVIYYFKPCPLRK